jgi:hypothetical protein
MIEKPFKWAFVGDLQIPYSDDRAVALWMKVMKAWKPDAIDIVGDIDDLLEMSTFSDGTTDEFFNKLKKEKQLEDESDKDFLKRVSPVPYVMELTSGARDFYTAIRKQHKSADIHSSCGNHEQRLPKYMNKKAPDFLNDVTYEKVYSFDKLGIAWSDYSERPKERFAGIYVHHGDGSTTTGLQVKNDIDNYDISLVRGHDHRGGVVNKVYPLSGRRLVGMGTGHMCDPNQYGLKYAINPSWDLGFGIGYVYGENVQLQFINISPDYKCVVDGKLFTG